jgi:hypothetical protein
MTRDRFVYATYIRELGQTVGGADPSGIHPEILVRMLAEERLGGGGVTLEADGC